MAEKLTLASMCAGGVQERIDRALAKISDNILDLNTDAKKKRVLDVKITLTPNEDDREDVSVEVQTSVKLAPEMGLKTQLFINKDFRSGVTTLTEHAKGAIKGQLTLDECGMCMDPEKDSTPTAEELGCDPETGEVLEEKSEPPKESTKVISMRDAVNSYEALWFSRKHTKLSNRELSLNCRNGLAIGNGRIIPSKCTARTEKYWIFVRRTMWTTHSLSSSEMIGKL